VLHEEFRAAGLEHRGIMYPEDFSTCRSAAVTTAMRCLIIAARGSKSHLHSLRPRISQVKTEDLTLDNWRRARKPAAKLAREVQSARFVNLCLRVSLTPAIWPPRTLGSVKLRNHLSGWQTTVLHECHDDSAGIPARASTWSLLRLSHHEKSHSRIRSQRSATRHDTLPFNLPFVFQYRSQSLS
jgi:hypothetical protein